MISGRRWLIIMRITLIYILVLRNIVLIKRDFFEIEVSAALIWCRRRRCCLRIKAFLMFWLEWTEYVTVLFTCSRACSLVVGVGGGLWSWMLCVRLSEVCWRIILGHVVMEDRGFLVVGALGELCFDNFQVVQIYLWLDIYPRGKQCKGTTLWSASCDRLYWCQLMAMLWCRRPIIELKLESSSNGANSPGNDLRRFMAMTHFWAKMKTESGSSGVTVGPFTISWINCWMGRFWVWKRFERISHATFKASSGETSIWMTLTCSMMTLATPEVRAWSSCSSCEEERY